MQVRLDVFEVLRHSVKWPILGKPHVRQLKNHCAIWKRRFNAAYELCVAPIFGLDLPVFGDKEESCGCLIKDADYRQEGREHHSPYLFVLSGEPFVTPIDKKRSSSHGKECYKNRNSIGSSDLRRYEQRE